MQVTDQSMHLYQCYRRTDRQTDGRHAHAKNLETKLWSQNSGLGLELNCCTQWLKFSRSVQTHDHHKSKTVPNIQQGSVTTRSRGDVILGNEFIVNLRLIKPVKECRKSTVILRKKYSATYRNEISKTLNFLALFDSSVVLLVSKWLSFSCRLRIFIENCIFCPSFKFGRSLQIRLASM